MVNNYKNITGFIGKLIMRGDSYRLELWSLGLTASTSSIISTLFGHGLGNELKAIAQDGVILSHYHNLYINIMFYSGLTGLCLFLSCVIYITAHIRKTYILNSPWLPVFLGSLSACMFDGIHILNNQGAMMFTLVLSMFYLGTLIDSHELGRSDAESARS